MKLTVELALRVSVANVSADVCPNRRLIRDHCVQTGRDVECSGSFAVVDRAAVVRKVECAAGQVDDRRIGQAIEVVGRVAVVNQKCAARIDGKGRRQS